MKDLSNVMMMEFSKDYVNWTENFLAVFNINKVAEADVLDFIYGGELYHPDIIIVSPEQWQSVFGE